MKGSLSAKSAAFVLFFALAGCSGPFALAPSRASNQQAIERMRSTENITQWRKRLCADPTALLYLKIKHDAPARVIDRGQPAVYPSADREDFVDGCALIAFVVGTDGSVRMARVLEATLPEFGQAALASVRTMRFQPATERGKPVPVLLIIPISFHSSLSASI